MSEIEKQNAEKLNKQSIENMNKNTNNADEKDFNKENLGIHQVIDKNNNKYEISEAKNIEKLSQENIGENK